MSYQTAIQGSFLGGFLNVAVIVPTLNAGPSWNEWISALLATGVNAKDVYVVDSGSTDDTVLLATKAGFNVKQITPDLFNHGGTRQKAVTTLTGYNLVILITQDAILSAPDSLHNLIFPFNDKQVAAVCGRQLPRKSAILIEAHARLYNYAPESFVRSINDVDKFGLKTAFISNSFAAYRVAALNEVGGFPEDVIFGEDMYVAARLLKAGYKIAYAADACVYHSHGYTVVQEFKRYFDMGTFHANEPWIRDEFGGAEGEGVKFVISEIKYLMRSAFWQIPEALFRTLLRYTGFRLGLLEKRLPLKVKRLFTMNKGYFEN